MTDVRSTGQPARMAPGRGPGEATGWVGWVIFASVMMFIVGCFHVIAGLVALFDEGYYLVNEQGLVVSIDYTAWGWIHLILGIVVVAAGFALMAGRTWGRVVAIALAVLSALANLTFLAAYPVWSALIIALDVVVIYAVTVHGGEVRALD